ncbi:MAG: type II secretion system protein [Verrucomicrobia bacterium]|nr:type II secretion system protein [Verrucomicrobiota bacterium]MCH8526041.1 type II secretion system GspH family protein [Kiritimatiellia bacterium]
MKHPPENKQAFTLPEVMMTVSILSIVYVMASSFIFSSMQVNAMTTGKTLVSRDIRQFTQRFGQDARAANHMSILKGIRTNQQVTQLNSGDTGDFILFYYQEYDYAEKKLTVYRVVGYYRLVEDASTGEGPVFRFSETGSWDTVNDYPLPRLHRRGLVSEATNQTLEVQEVVQLTRGLADGNLFYNYAQRRAVIVRGEIDNPGRMGQNAINTYNFTVFPRG